MVKMNKLQEKKFFTILNLAGNVFLFLIKIFIGLLTGSIALIADSLNSLSDMFSSSLGFVAVRIASKKADSGHPFGHERAESIAGIVIGVLVIVIGIEIAKEGLIKLIFGNEIQFGLLAVIVLLITIAVKTFLAFQNKRIGTKNKSMVFFAMAEDCKADVLISISALIGVVGAMNGFTFLDSLMALLISVYIIWNGTKIVLEGSNQLIGKAPSKKIIQEIKEQAMEIQGVKGVHDIKAQILGNKIQVEVHIILDESISIDKAHSIGKNVQYSIESIKDIERAFIHLDPFKGSYFWNNEKLE